MLLVLDNYDSFVHNLARYFRRRGYATEVLRSDTTNVAAIRKLRPQAIVLSPGPNTPDQAGCCMAVVEELSGEIPMLGVCLGHQVIAQVFGGKIVRSTPTHGVPGLVHHRGTGLYTDMPSPFAAGRYHSLIADRAQIPKDLTVNAWLEDDENQGLVMGVEHAEYPIFGMQFHPESILTQHGDRLIGNFLRCAGLSQREVID